MNNILIFGKNGMLGKYIFTYLNKYHNINGTERKDFDVYELFKTNNLKNKIIEVINIYKPKYIINCIGNINKKQSLNNPNDFYVINSYFPIILSNICAEKHITLIHPTTDCVFSGYETFYDENFIPNPNDDYGLSKFLGENINACVIRTSIIGLEKDNKRSLISWIIDNRNSTINGYTNHFWNGITCLEYAKLIHHIIINKSHWIGIKHFCSTFKEENFVTKYELVKEISNIFNLNINVIPHETKIKCDRTLEGIILKKDLQEQLLELKDFII